MITGSSLQDSFYELCEQREVEPVKVKSYTTAHFIRPEYGSLLETWIAMTDEERLVLKNGLPRLYTAVFLAIKGTVPDAGRCGIWSPGGAECRVEGEHDVHISNPADVGGSEVWR